LEEGVCGERLLMPPGWVLLAIRYAGGRVPSKLHLVKGLALFARLTGREDELEYGPYKMGLYSPLVEEALASVIERGFVRYRRGYGYELRPEGLREAERLEGLLADEDASLLARVMKRVVKMSRDELLLYQYVLFCDEECRAASREWKRVRPRRRQLALSLLRKRLVTVALAAKLAGMEFDEFLDYARKQGLALYEYRSLEEARRDIDAAKKACSSR